VRRLVLLLLAALYLAVPGVLLLHELEEQAEACGTCPDLPGPRLECADDDCSEDSHHHHRTAHHDAANCRLCSSGIAHISEPFSLNLAQSYEVAGPLAVAASHGSTRFLWGSIRAPPALTGLTG
jgi:hypothetical protein